MLEVRSESTLRGTMHTIGAESEMRSAIYEAAMRAGHDALTEGCTLFVWCDDDALGGIVQAAWNVVLGDDAELLAA